MNPLWRKNPRRVETRAAEPERLTLPGVFRTDPASRMADELIELRSRLGKLEQIVHDHIWLHGGDA